ncbi:MAG: hypothetical protein GY768_07100 [Planctomycetaceae bacterium]|nr:hypothetical protein [Planctomycetaceae bacterium]
MPQSDLPANEPSLPIVGPRLSGRGSLSVVGFTLLLWLFFPWIWAKTDSFITPRDYRTPIVLSDDYWQFSEFTQQASSRNQVTIFGDSVIWGEYVLPNHSLAGHLNRSQDQLDFANGGVNGMHPLAMEGLVKHFAQSVQSCPVLLHCNLLWLSTPDRDLSASKELPFNHPTLVPQFDPWIPCYHATISDRLGNLVFQRSSLRQLVRHQRSIYFSGLTYPTWSLQRGRLRRAGTPVPPQKITSRLPQNKLRHEPIPWTERGISLQSYPWVNLNDSLQWKAFQNTLMELRSRKCDVFVLVGPFNAHLLEPESHQQWMRLRDAVSSWFSSQEVNHATPNVLPSDLYGDASHPLDRGYQTLTTELLTDFGFQNWLKRNSK